ncbi:MAG: ZipA [Candidatus Dactylopiibacterium carminicum]|uniref:Cell division protein ZipA n=1 Tax=Candidatus Dactylopiibacterium carminicum TaxID=857335 RepID=A0A272EXN8_9RHOO|nr:cell division protein ZipA C-terminal FtsZ-binding domain-containing protein [Candidatus Dactylopiibacterium carminicum]KAF7600544.1 ZipA [Candidatus Dactylopiibacterium carminicum]PAS94887.1 MAG: ZipA [Candidatus Dactylopiibacterium carminicum]PAS98023.1 MAG: ZipA [Candidatus Dactylopiibacterium carminicum]PAT00548.1 MAG: hypothetical protein BSR46_02300 [Candidatus Dactylopiibacterium carminicum]
MSGNELQYGLIGLSVVAIFALVVYNLWQERRARKAAEQAFRSDHHDVLLEGDVEPAVPPAPGGRMEPSLHEVEVEQPSARPAAAASKPTRASEPVLPWEARAIDCAVSIEAPAGVAAAALFAAQQEVLAGVSRRLQWYGWNDQSHEWFALDARSPGSLSRACVTLQLADRRGAISESELKRFFDQLQRVCEQFLAVPRLPTSVETLRSAVELDGFCADVDIQIAVNVIATSQPFSGPRLRAAADAADLQLGADGTYQALDDAGQLMFSLANQESAKLSAEQLKHLHTRGLTLVLDVPRVRNPMQVFDRMLGCARQLAEALGGQLVDDNRNPFSDRAIDLIRSQIGQFEMQMERASIPAGGSLARRLFA